MNGYKKLTYKNRKQLEALYIRGDTPGDIAKRLGICIATVYRELQRGRTGNIDRNGRAEYNAERAQEVIYETSRRREEKLRQQAAARAARSRGASRRSEEAKTDETEAM